MAGSRARITFIFYTLSRKDPELAPQDSRTTRLHSRRTIARRHVGAGEAFEHDAHRGLADVAAGLVDGGERHGEERCVIHVVDADDADVAGNAQTGGEQGVHQVAGDAVVGADEGLAFAHGRGEGEGGGGMVKTRPAASNSRRASW